MPLATLTRLNKIVLVPVANAYRAALPEPVRDSVHDFLQNLNEPIIFANDVLQARPDLAGTTAARFVVNSTVGLGGAISSVAGAFSAAVIGRVLDATGNNYTVVFFACASVYVIATVIIHFILPHRRASMVAVPADTGML